MTVRYGAASDRDSILRLRPHEAKHMPDGEGSYFMIAEEDGKLRGFAAVFRRAIPAPVAKEEAFVNVIEVFEEADCRRGIGSRLVREIIAVERQRRTYQVRAYCDAGNVASHRLWVKNGFGISPVKIGERTVGSYATYVLNSPC